MIEFSFPMWTSGAKIELAQVLGSMPSNSWVWNVVEFDGVGHMPDELSVDEFERAARMLPFGHRMTWSELNAFAAGVSDTWWLLALASLPDEILVPEDIRTDDFRRNVFVLRGFDSSTWEIEVPLKTDDGVNALERVRAEFGSQ